MGLLVKVGADLRDFNKDMKRATKDISYLGTNLKNVGRGLTKNVTVPIIGIGVASAKVGIDFESQMNRVAAISGATGGDLEALKNKALELGKNTKFSATEAAEGLEYFAMAGYSVEDSVNAIGPTLDLAIASGTDLATTADIVSDAMTAFGMESKDTAKFTDLLASVSKNANTNVEMLGESFKYVAPVAGAMGYSAEDVAEALGLMANSGIKGSQAGTALRGALTRLAKPTDEASTIMKDLGIQMADAEGNMLPLDNVIGQLRGSFGGLTEEQQAQYASTLFGKEAMSGMLAVINASEEGIDKLSDATSDYDGTASKMAETMQSGTGGALEKLKSSLESLGIALSETILPVLNKVIEKVQGLVDKFNALSPEQKESIVKFAAIAAAIGPLLMVVGQGITMFGKLKALFTLIGPALSTSLGPILLIVAAIGILIAVFVNLYKNNEEFRNKVNALWEQVKIMFQAAFEFIGALIQFFIDLFSSMWESNFANIQGIISSGWELITSIFSGAVQLITDLFGVFTSLLQGDWQGALDKLISLGKNLWNNIKAIFLNLVNFILNLFGTNLEAVVTKAKEKIEKIKALFQGFKDKVKSIIDGIKSIWEKFKLPTFTITTKVKTILGKEIKYPTGFKINWHADGGIFTRPTVLGGHGFGEAGKEAILPLNKLPGLLGLDKQGVNHIVIYLDGKKIYDGLDTYLGNKTLGGL